MLAGCGTVHDTVQDLKIFSAGDACAATMRNAFPGARFEVASQTAKPLTTTLTEVAVEARRVDTPPSPLANESVAVACRFDHNILVDFHWTKPPIN